MVLIMHFAFKQDTTSSMEKKKSEVEQRGRTSMGGDVGNRDKVLLILESVAHFNWMEGESGGSLQRYHLQHET